MIATTATIQKKKGGKNVTMYNIGHVDRFKGENPDYMLYYCEDVIDIAEIARRWAFVIPSDERYIRSIANHLTIPVTRTWNSDDNSFTMNNILCDMGMRVATPSGINHVAEPLAIELGKFINLFLPQREFTKVNVTVGRREMSVKLYYSYERKEIEQLVKIFFMRLDLIDERHRLLYYFNIAEFFPNFVSSLAEGPEKEVLYNMYVRNDTEKVIERNLNYMSFQHQLMSHLPSGKAPEIVVNETGLMLFSFDAHYNLMAEEIALWIASCNL